MIFSLNSWRARSSAFRSSRLRISARRAARSSKGPIERAKSSSSGGGTFSRSSRISVAKWAGVDARVARGLLALGSAICGGDFEGKGPRTLESLGLAGLSRAAMAKLFRDEADVRQVIKMKAIYELLETVTDRCEDVANIIEGIVLENS